MLLIHVKMQVAGLHDLFFLHLESVNPGSGFKPKIGIRYIIACNFYEIVVDFVRKVWSIDFGLHEQKCSLCNNQCYTSCAAGWGINLNVVGFFLDAINVTKTDTCLT